DIGYLGNSTHDIAARTRATNAMHTVHLGYYHELMREIPAKLRILNELIAPALAFDMRRLDKVEYTALLIGTYELAYSRHVPYKVVIDEAILLNAHFGATDGYKLINAVLDNLAKSLRPDEVASNALAQTPPTPDLG
ncbi:MAG: transcription antitermination factor NusB, partial [Moraxella sp.]|nr:transcription antitermination factor NusB [Moraxella sp.]